MSELICQMDCHSCQIQEGIENKKTCAVLLIPSMLKKLENEISEIKFGIELLGECDTKKHPLPELKKVKIEGKSSLEKEITGED